MSDQSLKIASLSHRLNMLGNLCMNCALAALFIYFYPSASVSTILTISALYTISYYCLITPIIYFVCRKFYRQDIITERLFEMALYIALVIGCFWYYQPLYPAITLIAFLHVTNYLCLIIFHYRLEEAEKTQSMLIFSDIIGFLLLATTIQAILQTSQITQLPDHVIWSVFKMTDGSWSTFFQNFLALMLIQGVVQFPTDSYRAFIEWHNQKNAR